MGTMVSFQRPDGQTVQGYLAEPAQASGAPAVVVIQEWWGLNDQIRGVADRLAQAGYQALVPDPATRSFSTSGFAPGAERPGSGHRRPGAERW